MFTLPVGTRSPSGLDVTPLSKPFIMESVWQKIHYGLLSKVLTTPLLKYERIHTV
jgi:hypothetical protein